MTKTEPRRPQILPTEGLKPIFLEAQDQPMGGNGGRVAGILQAQLRQRPGAPTVRAHASQSASDSAADDALASTLRRARLAAILGEEASVGAGGGSDDLNALVAKAADFYAQSVSADTRRHYRRRWRAFVGWCRAHGLPSLPATPDTVMLYLADSTDASVGTLRGWIAAINRIHIEAGFDPPGADPAIAIYLRAVRRAQGWRPATNQVAALRIADLRSICRALDAVDYDPVEIRDRALLVLHKAGLGSSEIARLIWSDIRLTPRRATIQVSGTSRRRAREVVIRSNPDDSVHCGVEALRAWKVLTPPLGDAAEGSDWVITPVDSHGGRTPGPLRPQQVSRLRWSRLASLGRPGDPASVDVAIGLLGGRPPHDLRDKAVLLLGFAGAFRRPDLVGLLWRDLTCTDAGLVVRLRRSKTDIEGRGTDVGIPFGRSPMTCPVRAVQAWRTRVESQLGPDIDELPCFPPVGRAGRIGIEALTPDAVTRLVKRRTEELALTGTWGGRSLRAGFISTAADLDVPLETIAKQSRHATLDSLIRYIRNDDPFRRNPAAQVGL